MINDKKKKITLILLLSSMLMVFLLEILMPDKFQHDGTVSKIERYKILWLILGILQVLLTMTFLFFLISSSLRQSGYKLKAFLEILVVLCIAVLWLWLTLSPARSYLRRYGGTNEVKIRAMQ